MRRFTSPHRVYPSRIQTWFPITFLIHNLTWILYPCSTPRYNFPRKYIQSSIFRSTGISFQKSERVSWEITYAYVARILLRYYFTRHTISNLNQGVRISLLKPCRDCGFKNWLLRPWKVWYKAHSIIACWKFYLCQQFCLMTETLQERCLTIGAGTCTCSHYQGEQVV